MRDKPKRTKGEPLINTRKGFARVSGNCYPICIVCISTTACLLTKNASANLSLWGGFAIYVNDSRLSKIHYFVINVFRSGALLMSLNKGKFI